MSKKCFVGVDVSAKDFCVAIIREGAGGEQTAVFPNDRKGHKGLVKLLKSSGVPAFVCMEATGNYGFGLAIALSSAEGIEVMVVNPRSAKDFTRAINSRNKTDKTDASALAQYASRMPFVRWTRPSKGALELRSISRQIEALTSDLVCQKNRLHALRAGGETSSGAAIKSVKETMAHFGRQIAKLTKTAMDIIGGDDELSSKYAKLTSVKGIGKKSAINVLGELSVLPDGMDGRQWTAHAGLDPRRSESGSSVRKPDRIGKGGNRRLRKALFMPALVAVRCEARVKGFYEKLVSRGKRRLSAVVAVMRKLLVAIWGMFKNGEEFDSAKAFRVANN